VLLENFVHIPVDEQCFPFADRNLHAAVLNIDAAGVDAGVAEECPVEHFGCDASVAYTAMATTVHFKCHILWDTKSLVDRVGGPGRQGFTGSRQVTPGILAVGVSEMHQITRGDGR